MSDQKSNPLMSSSLPVDMSLRDYIALQALRCFLSHGGFDTSVPARLSSDAYMVADAMILEKNKVP